MVALSSLLSLVTLDLEINQIRDVTPLADLSGLEDLNLHRNQVSDLTPLKNLDGLTSLCLAFNQIRDIGPLAGLIGLKWLDISCNDITDLTPAADLIYLRALLAGANRISDFVALEELVLRVFDLGDNNVSDIAPAIGGVLGPSGKLIIAGNPLSLTSLDETVPQLEAMGFDVAMQRETIVSFADDALETVVRSAIDRPAGLIFIDLLSDITDLQAPDAGITDLSGIERMHKLQKVDLSGNAIVDTTPLAYIHRLTSLDVSANRIERVSPIEHNVGLGSGDHLILTGNPLDAESTTVSIPYLTERGVLVSH